MEGKRYLEFRGDPPIRRLLDVDSGHPEKITRNLGLHLEVPKEGPEGCALDLLAPAGDHEENQHVDDELVLQLLGEEVPPILLVPLGELGEEPAREGGRGAKRRVKGWGFVSYCATQYKVVASLLQWLGSTAAPLLT